MNISKSGIYRAAAKQLILLYPDVVEWMTRNVDHSNRILLNFDKKNVARYQPYKIHRMYHFKEHQIKTLRNGYKVKKRLLVTYLK